jgi:hypothetical protein
MTHYIGFRDPVGPGTVSVIGEPDDTYEELERFAALLWYLALTHRLDVGKVNRMALAIVYHLDPIDAAKVPHVTDWANAATTDANQIEEWWLRWPLAMPGVPLERCGLVVVDADRHGGPDGVALIREMTLPPHPIVATKSGEHHYFRQPSEPVRFMQWAGGQVLGIGRFVVGYSVPEGVMPELPEVFRAGSAKPATTMNRKYVCPSTDGVVASDRLEALRAMDPRDWNHCEHNPWFELMVACKYVGIARDDFIEWSVSDPDYADHGDAPNTPRSV